MHRSRLTRNLSFAFLWLALCFAGASFASTALQRVVPISIDASAFQAPDGAPQNAIDGRSDTRWIAWGEGHNRCIIDFKEEYVGEWLSPASASAKRLEEILSDRARPFYEHRIVA